MSSQEARPANLSVQNIGGIEETSVSLDRGVNVLVGKNATNRTSLMRSLMCVLGSSNVYLRTGMDEGEVALTLGDSRYTRTLTRTGQDVTFGGDPYQTDVEDGGIFAFLLEDNPIRQSIRDYGDGLSDLLMAPVDTEEIQTRLDRLRNDISAREDELAETEDAAARLPEVREQIASIDDEIETLEAERDEQTRQIEAVVSDLEAISQDEAHAERRREYIERRTELADERQQKEAELDARREKLAELESERDRLEDQLADLAVPEDETVESLRRRISETESRVEELREAKAKLRNIVSENRSLLADRQNRFVRRGIQTLETFDAGHDHVTDQLSEEDVQCHLCGSVVGQSQVRAVRTELTNFIEETLDPQIASLESEASELASEKETLVRKRDRRESLQSDVQGIEDEIAVVDKQISSLEDRIADLGEETADLDETIDEMESPSDRVETLEQRESELRADRRALENELNRKRGRRESLVERRDSLEAKVAERESLEAELEDLRSERDELKTHVADRKQRLVDRFNETMAEVLDTLQFDNIERIWLETRRERQRVGRRREDVTVFEVNVTREIDGVAREGKLKHLSESEREVTGLVMALTGYMVHDIRAEIPFLLVDSLEAIDADRIQNLLPYLADHTEFLVVALLPEDAPDPRESYNTLSEI